MRPSSSAIIPAAALLLAVTACGSEDDTTDAVVDEQAVEDEASDAAGDDDASDAAGDDDASDPADDGVTDDRLVVSLDGEPLDAIPDTLQCVAFPDGTDRIVAEVSDPSVADDDPAARMSLVLDDDGEESTVRISAGLNVGDEINGSWAADPADAAAIDIDPEVGASFDELTIELEELLYDGDPSPQQRTLSADIDCT